MSFNPHNDYSTAEHGYDPKSDPYNYRHSNEKHVDHYGGDTVEVMQPKEEETHRSLKPRQISMIAIGGAIVSIRRLGWNRSMPETASEAMFEWMDADNNRVQVSLSAPALRSRTLVLPPSSSPM